MLDNHCHLPPTEHIDPFCTRPRVPCLMTAVAPEYQPSCNRKRRRGAIEEEHSTTATPDSPPKSAKGSRHSQRERTTAYYNSLSKLWLTRRALQELDRRNKQRASLVRPTVARDLGLGDESDQLENLSTRLKRFARHGGPDLRDLREVSLALEISRSMLTSSLQHPEPSTSNYTTHVMPPDQSSLMTKSKSRNTLGDAAPKTDTSKTKNTSAYDPNFEQNLIDNRIYPDDYEFPDGRDPPRPKNENEIHDRLGQPRSSLSPSRFPEKAFREFKQGNSRVLTEDDSKLDGIVVIQGTHCPRSVKNLSFGNLKSFTHGILVKAQPDMYDGARPGQIELQIRDELKPFITPSKKEHAPALPNFFTEVKGPDGSGAVAKRQACYNGALGARGVHKLRSFGVDPALAYDDKAYAITSTYHCATGTLQMYTVHPNRSNDPNDSPEYHMSQLRSFSMTDTAERFREGARAFRNARDWAKEQRDELITAANGRTTGMPKETSTLKSSTHRISQSTIEPVTLGSETSADELSLDVGKGSSRSNKRLKR